MIIDFHTHTFPDKVAATAIPKLSQTGQICPFTDGTNNGLIASAKSAGINYSLLLPVATTPKQVASINASACKINHTQFSSGLLSFASIHPHSEDWREELMRIAGLGFKGIKIHPVYQQVDICDIHYLRILSKAAELGLMVVTHSGIDLGYPEALNCTPQKIRSAIDAVPNVTLICAHMGGWLMWEEAIEYLADTHVYLDTSFSTCSFAELEAGYHSSKYKKTIDTDLFLKFVNRFGADRLLFGSDSPWGDQKENLDSIRALPLSQEEKEKILGGNARKLLSL